MNKIPLYIVLGLLILVLLKACTRKYYKKIEFFDYFGGYRVYPNWPLSWAWPWNQPTRIPKLYYDIRGDPNIVYRRYMFGGYTPYGYVFGPYLYDTQGNLLRDKNKPYYIA